MGNVQDLRARFACEVHMGDSRVEFAYGNMSQDTGGVVFES